MTERRRHWSSLSPDISCLFNGTYTKFAMPIASLYRLNIAITFCPRDVHAVEPGRPSAAENSSEATGCVRMCGKPRPLIGDVPDMIYNASRLTPLSQMLRSQQLHAEGEWDGYVGGATQVGAHAEGLVRRYLNNRAENSHRPTRRRERQMQRFKSPKQAQGFLSAHSFIYGHFRPRRHRLAASVYRTARTEAFNIWRQENCARHAS